MKEISAETSGPVADIIPSGPFVWAMARESAGTSRDAALALEKKNWKLREVCFFPEFTRRP